ncbi:Catalyzes methyl transfer from S-methylmethionine (SMM) to adenosyl-L-homocysteine (AdoMet) [Orbilia ellipsospora]|uniref:Catalyzes methyl transfer from S-methylmethionine (SMM) to adenosyl-L-homocysteine (AdoMet) n=1 Tax=Orbilia ellipsospora TaxID=2528407 RepID=A0AAV9WVJ9_9PEZI
MATSESQKTWKSQIIILDGAMGTLLCDTTSPEASTSPLWSSADLLLKPERLSNIHKRYLSAGAIYISTATYQLSRDSLLRGGISDEQRVRDIFAAGMRVALEAARGFEVGGGGIADKAAVALSLGPFGACLQPSQEYSGIYPPPYDQDGQTALQSLKEWHEQRLHMFQMGSPISFESLELLAFETVPWKRLDEITAIREVVDSEVYRQKKAWISLVYPEAPDEEVVTRIVKEVFREIPSGSGPRGIGINCTKLDIARDISKTYSKAVKELGLLQKDIFLVIYPDGGLTYNVDTKTWSDESGIADAEKWSELMVDIVKEASEEGCWGSIMVGGCCKTTPHHIQKLSEKCSSF